MSQLKKIKSQISVVSRANKLCNSMSTLSTIKMSKLKNRLKTIEHKLKLIGSIIYKTNRDLFDFSQKNLNFIFFSDFGFCGEFNKYSISDEDIAVGLKSKISEVKSDDLQEIKAYIEKKIMNNYNFSFECNDFNLNKKRKIHFKSFISDYIDIGYNTIIECTKESLKKTYFRTFIEYMHVFSTLQENCYRSQIMKNAVDNSKKILQDLVVNLNKTRQMNITNEILLIVSARNED